MGTALFYHLTRSPADALVPILIDKAREQGWRVALRGTDAGRLARLDDLLWLREGFLPHGRAGGADDARQPVLLSLAGEAEDNAPSCLITLDGAEVSPEECSGLERVCILFDGADPAAVDGARNQWRSLTGAGIAAEYWNDSEGGWKRQRVSSPSGQQEG